jgi:hypothetical protein
MKKLLALSTLSLAFAAPLAFAKIPAPTLTPEAKAKAAEAAARTAWAAKVDNYKLCVSQDQVAAKYRASVTAAGKPVPAATPTPACADPGPFAFAAAPADAKPIEASGAHSPATTAASPPSSNQTSAETQPAPKK